MLQYRQDLTVALTTVAADAFDRQIALNRSEYGKKGKLGKISFNFDISRLILLISLNFDRKIICKGSFDRKGLQHLQSKIDIRT